MYETKGNDNHNSSGNVKFDKTPDRCPICHHAVHPMRISEGSIMGHINASTSRLQLVFRCSGTTCYSLFIATYKCAVYGGSPPRYELKSVAPETAAPVLIDEVVGRLSSSFVKVYTQAFAAGVAGLDEIAGVGFRKALEFLIKDYCVSKHPDEAELIKKTFLGECIKRWVADANIKKCAQRAAWLGNDETHYVRTWTDHDITDLKNLIRLTMNWVANELLTEQYCAEMPPGGAPSA